MNVREVLERVAMIADMAGDDEEAHSEEDALHREVLRAVAEGQAEDPAACARHALTTQEIKFARWCA